MSDTSAADEGLASRVSLFSRVWIGIVVLGVFAHITTTLMLGDPAELFDMGFGVHVTSIAPALVTWLVCRRTKSAELTRAVEASALLVYTAALTVMVRMLTELSLNQLSREGFLSARAASFVHSYYGAIDVFAVSITFTVRSALVPSRPGKTAILGTLMGVTMLAVLFVPIPWEAHAKGGATFELAVSTGSLWLLSLGVCTALAGVIHGLRREIAKARKLGQYTLGEKIGEGGMGTVFHASHAMLRRPTAVKLVQDSRVNADTIKRFEREVQLTAQLTHPNTITIYDYGRTPDGVFYYAMELLDGDTLQTIVDKQGAQPEARVRHVLRMVASALSEAHGRGLIHRDIKPANIMLGTRGGIPDFATVLDFGLVRELDAGYAPDLTTIGSVVGTPMYLAPEVITGKPATAQSDIYALGAVGYFMLTGATVFDGDTVVEVCGHHLHSPVTPPSQRPGVSVHAGLEALILACLEKDPVKRPASTGALADALEALDLPPWKPPRAG